MIAEKLFLKTLENLRYGRLELIAPSGRLIFGDEASDITSTLVVENPRFFSRAVFGGDDGAGDSYVDDDWWSPDLVSLVRIAVRNLATLQSGSRWSGILSAASRVAFRIRHLLRPNTISGSRRNIAAHYDLSNDFFRLFLDREMLYSSAIFAIEMDSLEDAQMHKLDHICRKLDLGPQDHVLEIGTGWGAFAACDRLLTPRGSMLMQTITMNEQRFPEYHRSSDWIQRRIFPGTELASLSEVLRSTGRATSLTLAHAEDIGLHYALTLNEWRRRFLDARAEVLRLNFDERFVRMWDYYLAYCEGAFRERYIGDTQLLFTKIHDPTAIWGDPAAMEAVASHYSVVR